MPISLIAIIHRECESRFSVMNACKRCAPCDPGQKVKLEISRDKEEDEMRRGHWGKTCARVLMKRKTTGIKLRELN